MIKNGINVSTISGSSAFINALVASGLETKHFYFYGFLPAKESEAREEVALLKDRKENDFVLSPTNEESSVLMVANKVTSYKNVPLNIYQINTKFRDEARPRFGLLRGREFTMKDAYSFDGDDESCEKSYRFTININ